MSIKPQLIPPNITHLMSDKDKKELGVIPQGQKVEIKREKDLQRLCEQELSRRNIEYLHLSPFAREKAGWPDLTFCAILKIENVHHQTITFPVPIACELKGPDGRLSEAQIMRLLGMKENGWAVYVCRTFDEFRGIFSGTTQEWSHEPTENKD